MVYIASDTEAGLLARATPLDRMNRLEVPYLMCQPTALQRLMGAAWFGRLRRVEIGLNGQNARAVVMGLVVLAATVAGPLVSCCKCHPLGSYHTSWTLPARSI